MLAAKTPTSHYARRRFSPRVLLIWIICAFLLSVGQHAGRAQAAAFVKWSCDETRENANCENNAVEYLYIYDSIDMETADAVARINGAIPLGKPFPLVYLNSDGGSGTAAYQIGRILKQRSASVEGKDMFFPNRMPSCNSACSLIAMGATTRNLIQVGIHQGGRYGTRQGKPYLKSINSEADLKADFEYLDEMGMAPRLKEVLQKTPHDEMAEFYLDLDDPFLEQDIVKLGFRMRVPVGEELALLRKLVLFQGEEQAGLRKTAEAGNDRSAFELGRALFFGTRGAKQDKVEGLRWLDRSGNDGNTFALHLLGVIYSNGYEGMKKDQARSVHYYLRAAKLGSSASQNNLAWHYYKGEGVKKNISEAIFWVTRSVEQGEPFAYGSLGVMRFEGNGFVRDDVETYKWLKLATTQMPEGKSRDGDGKTFEKLKRRMKPDQIAEGELLAREWRPLK